MEKDDIIKFWKIPIVLIIMFFISTLDLNYGFYTILRISAFILSLWFAFCCYSCDDRISMFTSIAIAIIWNPIIPIYLDKETWVVLDYIAIVIELVLLTRSYKVWRRTTITEQDEKVFDTEKTSNRLNRENEIKKYAIDYWIERLSNENEYHENVKINPELHKPEIMTNEEWISRCDKVISRNSNYIARLKVGDYELCKELESQEREA